MHLPWVAHLTARPCIRHLSPSTRWTLLTTRSLPCSAHPPRTVHDCQPQLNDLEALVERLNGGGTDFSGFVRAVRQEFQGVVANEMAAAA